MSIGLNQILIILKNYFRVLKTLLQFIIYSGLILLSSLIITLPLWYAATEHSKAYTWTVILVLILLFSFLTFMRIRKWFYNKKKEGLSTRRIIIIPLKNLVVFIFFIIFMYIIFYIYSKGAIYAAAPLTVIYLLMIGYRVFIHRRKHANSNI